MRRYLSIKNCTPLKAENKLAAARGGGWGRGEVGEGEQEVQASRYGRSESQGGKAPHRKYSQ